MTNRAHEAYLQEKILSAHPVELVCLLYGGALEAVDSARMRLAARDIRGRSEAISKAVQILAELAGALDHARAPELGRKLAALYDYMQRRLLEANLRQADGPLAEVQDLLRTLAEGWKGTSSAREANAPSAVAPESRQSSIGWSSWTAGTGSSEPEPALHGWSF